MSGAYLDASAIIPLLIEELGSAAVDRFLAAVAQPLIVSEFAAAEVASAFSRLIRTQALEGPQDAASRLADFDSWRASSAGDIDLLASDIRLARIFVRRFDLMLRAPDAIHAAVCQRADLLLVTMDRRLAAAAQDLGVRAHLLS